MYVVISGKVYAKSSTGWVPQSVQSRQGTLGIYPEDTAVLQDLPDSYIVCTRGEILAKMGAGATAVSKTTIPTTDVVKAAPPATATVTGKAEVATTVEV